MKNKNTILLFVLFIGLLIGAFFRFYQLGRSPQGLYLDEASIGYNAYSILKTGNDEYGKSLPLLFRSVGDFKTPVYIYLTAPLISMFGLSEATVRLPSAIFGFLTLLLLYILLREIIKSKHSQEISVISTLFLAISPWHIVLSRTTYETTVALFFLLLGIYLFLIAQKKTWVYLFASASLSLSFISYHAERLLAPVVFLSLLYFYRKNVFSKISKKIPIFIISLFIGVAIIGPTTLLMRSPGFLKRASTLNIFSYLSQMPYGYSEKLPNALNNKPILSLEELSSLYTSYFSPRYLFSLGDSSPRSSYPGLGSFFIWQLPLYLLGLYQIFQKNQDPKLKHFVLTLLLASPIPAALTRDPYSTIRALSMLIPLVILLALGALKLGKLLKNYSKKIVAVVIFVVISLSLLKLFVSIFYFNDYFRSSNWSYGWQQVVSTFPELNPNLPIIVDNSRGESYINILFFLKFDPKTYQQTNFEVSQNEYYNNLNRNSTKSIGNVTVKTIEWGIDTDNVEQYLVADNIAISKEQILNHNLTIIKEINYPNNETVFRIMKTNPLNK